MLEKYLAFYLLDIGVQVADNETKNYSVKSKDEGELRFKRHTGYTRTSISFLLYNAVNKLHIFSTYFTSLK